MSDDTRPNTASIHGERTSRMGRRRLLETLSAAGFGGFAAAHLTAEDVAAAASDQVPIVYAMAPDPDAEPSEDGAPVVDRTKNVPADWYDDIQHAFAAHESAGLGQRAGVVATAVDTAEYGGKNSSITVQLSQRALDRRSAGPDHVDDVRGALPEQVSGVPVETADVDVPQLHGCSDESCNNGDYGDLVPPGVECSGDDSGYLTLSARMEDGGGAKYFATNHHAFNDDGRNPYGDSLDHPAQDDPLGTVSQWDCKQDFVMAFPNDDHTIQTWTGPVECIGDRFMQGQFTKAGLSDHKAAGKDLQKIGQRTCHTKDELEGIDGYIGIVDDGCSERYKQVFWGEEWVAAAGDSGSPTFAPDPESSSYYLVASIHAGIIPKEIDTSFDGGYAFGTSGYGIYDKWGFRFA